MITEYIDEKGLRKYLEKILNEEYQTDQVPSWLVDEFYNRLIGLCEHELFFVYAVIIGFSRLEDLRYVNPVSTRFDDYFRLYRKEVMRE